MTPLYVEKLVLMVGYLSGSTTPGVLNRFAVCEYVARLNGMC